MSQNVQISIGSQHKISYLIEHRGNCILIFGDVPASAFLALTKLAPPKSVVDPDVARMFEANFAFGLAKDLQALKASEADNVLRREQTKNPGLSPEAVKWLAHGERGSSSNAIFSHLTGINASRRGSELDHPYDPADMRRCRLLLEAVPSLQAELGRMASVSTHWSRFVPAWDEICRVMDEEVPNWRDAKKCSDADQTYKVIQKIIRQ
jgi:hypothetical protein